MLEGGRRLHGAQRPHPPLLSILVVIYRDAEGLNRLLASILPQVRPYPDDIEVIVIDGGSDERPLALLRSLDEQIDYWRSEPDKGIYDAMNKGIACASGQYILHLNSGDQLLEIPVDELRECAAAQVDVACFAVAINESWIFRPRAGLTLKLDNAWHHQGTFYRRTAHPGYDLRYKVYADFDLNQRLAKTGKEVRLFRRVVAGHEMNGITSQERTRRHEVYRIICRNHGLRYLPLAFLRFQVGALRFYLRGLLNPRAR